MSNVAVRCVDRSAKCYGAGEAGLSTGRIVIGVSIGAGNHVLEVTAILALVLGRLGCDGRAPERALDVAERRWLRACLSLKAPQRLAALQSCWYWSGACRDRSLLVREGELVALRGLRSIGVS